ncbi:MAG: hypothetical protein ACXVI7_08485 [Halobacteriota archaeon]
MNSSSAPKSAANDKQSRDREDDPAPVYYFINHDGKVSRHEFLIEDLVPGSEDAEPEKPKTRYAKVEKLKL